MVWLGSNITKCSLAFQYANKIFNIKGTLDTSTPLKISAISNMFNAVLDPILMFTFALGVPGAALATLGAEVISAVSFLTLMLKRKMIRWSKILSLPKWDKLKP